MRAIYEILKKHYGYSSFRPNQEEIIHSVIEGKETVALLPTGGGKSICFQVPGLFFDGLCLVVSPLISLMEDQVLGLKKKGIKAEFIHSGMNHSEIQEILDRGQFGGLKFLYVSPERLNSDDFKEKSRQFPIDLIAIDEAHCISQWGYDFRPSYLKIKEFLEIHPEAKRIAVTATAKPRVVEDITEKLGFGDSQIFKSSFERKNLAYHSVNVNNKDTILIQSLNKYKGTAIVYCSTRKEVKRVCKILQLQGYKADFYHGGLSTPIRKKKQLSWIDDETRIMVATNAFGMGIDKPDVRLVVHYDIPENIENYFQEAGRAGRDLEESIAVILYENADIKDLKERIDRKFIGEAKIKEVYEKIFNHLQLALDTGIDEQFELDLLKFAKKYKLDIVETYNAIEHLESCGLVVFHECDESQSKIKIIGERDVVYQFQISNPNYDAFLRYLARSYPAIFDRHIPFIIEDFSKHLKTNYKRILEQLDYLYKHELIDYSLKSKNSKIHILQNRKKSTQIDLSSYRFIEKVARENLEQVLIYLENKTCRSQFLRSYFGDQTEENCGKCSYCARNKKAAKIDWIKLVGNGIELNELIILSHLKEKEALEQIENLVQEGKLKRDAEKFNFIIPT